MAYIPTVYVDGSAPDISAANLNKTENGLQAAAAVADAALPTPAGTNGQFLKRVGGVWVPTSFVASDIPLASIDQTYMAAGNKVTTSTLAGGPPASPTDKDIWIATAVDANGTRWAFQFNAGSASASKWEFIGGPPIRSDVDTQESQGATALANLPTVQSVVLARVGDYDMSFSVQAQNSVGATLGSVAAVNIGVTTFMLADFNANTTNNGITTVARNKRVTGVTAATTVTLQFSNAAGTMTYRERSLWITPVRIA